MPIRIPGPQPPLGLDRWFLDENPGWIPPPLDSGARQAGVFNSALDQYRGPGLQNANSTVYATGDTEQSIADGEAEGNNRSNAVNAAAGQVNYLRPDNISPSFGGVDADIGSAGAGIGQTPNVNLGVGVPPNISGPPQGQDGNQI